MPIFQAPDSGDMLERFQPKVFSPDGVAIGWPGLIRMGKQFGLAVS